MRHLLLAPVSIGSEGSFSVQMAKVPAGASAAIDMSAVSSLAPYDALTLLLEARGVAQRTGCPVELLNANPLHLSYLEGISFFRTAKDWVFTRQPIKKAHGHPGPAKALGLMRVDSHHDVKDVVDQVRKLLGGLIADEDLCDGAVSVAAELSNNAREHSGQEGYVTVYCYEDRRDGLLRVHIAVADGGLGVHQTLVAAGTSFPSDLTCMRRVLRGGCSRKGKNNGGNGLKKVSTVVSDEHFMLMRSGTAVVKREHGTVRGEGGYPAIEGTRAVVILKASA